MCSSFSFLILITIITVMTITAHYYKVDFEVHSGKVILDIKLTPMNNNYNIVHETTTNNIGNFKFIKESFKDGGGRLILLKD